MCLSIVSMGLQSWRIEPRRPAPFLRPDLRCSVTPSVSVGHLAGTRSSVGSELFRKRLPSPCHGCTVCREPVKVLEVEAGCQLIDHFLQGQKCRDDLESKEDCEDDVYGLFQGQIPQALIEEQEKD